jgi:hypothetical protein
MQVFTEQDGLTFRDADPITGEACHEYWLDGQRIISNTQILDAAGMVNYQGIAKETLKAKAAFGTSVHEMCLWWDQDDLDLADLEPYPQYLNRLLGWADFVVDYDFQPDMTWAERPMAVKLNGCIYAQRIDRLGMTNQGVAIVEIKTSCDLMPHYDLQTAGQALPFKTDARPTIRRFVCQLLDKPNAAGKRYFVKECTDRMDEKVFLAALVTLQWRINHKLYTPAR